MMSIYSVVSVHTVVIRSIGVAIACRIATIRVSSIIINVGPVRVVIVSVGVVYV